MTLRDRVPVEPLAPERMERLEQRIVAAAAPALQAPAKHTLWPWGLALASAAAAALAVYALRPAPPSPPAPPPLSMSTDDGATLTLGDATLAVGPATRFDVHRAGGGIDVRLDHGAVHLDVAPRAGRPPLWVHAGDVGVRVVGTAFTVSRAPGAGEVEVEVEHGTVEVHRGGTIASVTGGQRWSSRDGAVLAVAPSPPAPSGDASGGTGPGGSGRIGGTGPGGSGRIGAGGTHTDALAIGPAIDVAVLADRRTGIGPGGSIPGASGETARTGSVPDGSSARTGSRPRHDRPSGDTVTQPPADPLGDLRREIAAQRLAPSTSVVTGTADERLVDLRKVFLENHGADAAAALYGIARIQHAELGRHGDALRSLDMYLTRFTQGAEIEAVRWLRLRILCRGTIDDACRAAAHSYITQHGGDTARGKLAVRVTNVP